MLQDLRYALRLLTKTPGFTAIMILTLAVGIGASTALFSVVDSLLVRPFPYPDSERLVVVWSVPPRGGIVNVSPANFLDFRDQNRVFDSMGAASLAQVNVLIDGVAERLNGLRVSTGFFDTLGIRPTIGRAFSEAEDRPGAPRTAVLSYGAWQRRFGGDRSVVGQSITVDGEKCTVVGIMPPNFRFSFAPEILLPAAINQTAPPRDLHVLFALAKLKRGIPIEQARTQMRTLARNLESAYPAVLKGWGVDVWPWRDNFVHNDSRRVLVLFGAVGFVLLIACVNLANLLLVRATGRQRELAVRAAVGAGRRRLMRQMLTESVLLSVTGGAAGVLVAYWLAPLATTLVWEPVLAGLAPIGIDLRVLTFTLALSIFTGLLFGAVPAWRASRVNLHQEIKSATHGSLRGGWTGRLRGALVVAELALSLMLLVGAGLMIRSLAVMSNSDWGFRPDNVLTMRLTMPAARYAKPESLRDFERQVLGKVRALPGVRAAALGFAVPLERLAVPMRFDIASHPVSVAARPQAGYHAVSEGYFETLRIPLRKGRLFSERDNESAPLVAIVNQAFVTRFLSKEEPLGQRLILDERMTGGAALPWEIVGVVGTVKISGSDPGDRPIIYTPRLQSPSPGGILAVRAETAVGLARAVRAAVAGVDRDVPVTDVKTMTEVAAESMAQPRSQAWILGSFAVVALILAALGIYGVMSYSVAQTTREMGVRIALGAQPRDLLSMTARKGAVMAVLGLALGLAGSFALKHVVEHLLFQVKTTDPLTYAAVSLLLLAVAMLAAYIPARRASKVDPLVALRWE